MATKHMQDLYADKFVINSGETGSSVVDDLTIGGSATVAETLTVTGVLTASGGVSNSKTLTTEAGTGITTGTGTVYKSGIHDNGGIIHTRILVDLTGLSSSAAADIIGKEATANCHIGQVTAADCGTVFGGLMTCLEAPATGEPDIDIYSATESTGTEDAAITSLDETAILAAAADWTIGTQKAFGTIAADQYLYLVGSGGGTDAVYTAGKFLIELFGYDA